MFYEYRWRTGNNSKILRSDNIKGRAKKLNKRSIMIK